MTSFQELGEKFAETFLLNSERKGRGRPLSLLRHDSGHIMTGCGIGLAEELRISALQYSLWDYGPLGRALERQKGLYQQTIDMYCKRGTMNIDENGLEQKEFQKIQARTKRLSSAEVAAFYDLGMQIQKLCMQLTGKRYMQVEAHDMAALDFSAFDFTKQAADIKRTLESSENAEVAERSAKVLHYASLRKGGGHVIPAAGSPWHGPLMKPYR